MAAVLYPLFLLGWRGFPHPSTMERHLDPFRSRSSDSSWMLLTSHSHCCSRWIQRNDTIVRLRIWHFLLHQQGHSLERLQGTPKHCIICLVGMKIVIYHFICRVPTPPSPSCPVAFPGVKVLFGLIGVFIYLLGMYLFIYWVCIYLFTECVMLQWSLRILAVWSPSWLAGGRGLIPQ